MNKGMTLVELLMGVGILIILALLAIPTYRYLQAEQDLNDSAKEITNALRLAQNETLASEGDSQYGIHFDSSSVPHKYTLFKGSNYAARDIPFDKIYKLPRTVEIYLINLQGGLPEVVFDRLIGTTSQYGDVSMRLQTDSSKTRTVYINGSGQITLDSASSGSDAARVKDSRHVHIDYSRLINTATEIITLTFTYNASTVTQDIVIADNMESGQIYWEGEVDVNGEIQKLKVHTHRLNNPDTQFCIHRDRRYNDKALTITISDDVSGYLVDYSADGLTTAFTSFFVTSLELQ